MLATRADHWIPAAPLDGTLVGACPLEKHPVQVASFGLAGNEHAGFTEEHDDVAFQAPGRDVIRWNTDATLRFRWVIEGFEDVIHAQIEIWRRHTIEPLCTHQITAAAGECEVPRGPAGRFLPQQGPFMARLRLTECREVAGIVVGARRCYFDLGVLVVIGAGAAGIAATRHLLDTTTDSVVLIEARDRVGGRAWSAPAPWDGASRIDMGCQWIQSPTGNRLGLIGQSTTHAQLINYAIGQQLHPMNDTVEMQFMNAQETCRPDESLAQAYQRVLQAAQDEPEEPEDAPAAEVFADLMQGELAELDESIAATDFTAADETSYIVNASGLPGQEEDEPHADGGDPLPGKQVLEASEEELAAGLRLHTLAALDTSVTIPHYGFNGNLLADEGLGTRIAAIYQDYVATPHAARLTLLTRHQADNVELLGDHPYAAVNAGPLGDDQVIVEESRFGLAARGVVVAVPTSIINAGRLTFTPALPARIATAFAALPLGHYKKIFLQLDPTHAFCTRLDALADEKGDGFTAATPTAMPVQADLVLITRQQEHMWKFIYQRRGADRRILAFIGGTRAAALDNDDTAAYNAALRALAGPLGLADNAAYLDTVGLVQHRQTSHWSIDPWSRGAYSYTAVNAHAPRTLLRRAKLNGRLVFAGEANWVEESGTAHGALYSGELAARLLLTE